jgi:hypothetical protein
LHPRRDIATMAPMPRFRRPSLLRLARHAWLRHLVVALALLLATGNAFAGLATASSFASVAASSAHHGAAGSPAAHGCHAPSKASLPACPYCAGDHCACLAGGATPALPSAQRNLFVPQADRFVAATRPTALRPAHASPPLRPPAT